MNSINASTRPSAPPEIPRREALAALGIGAFVAAGAAIAQPSTQPTPPATNPTRPKDLPAKGPPTAIVPGNLAPAELHVFDEATGLFVLPALPYAFDAMEPYIDAKTMEIHHDKHHAGYVAGLNKSLAELARIRSAAGDSGLVKFWANQVSFHGGGHINHSLFWNMMAPPGKGGGGSPRGALAEAINKTFGSYEQFVAQFKATAGSVEGGGWGWLAVEPWSKQLLLFQGEKQQDLMVTGALPVLGIDVWEHAYYLKYQNKRAEYVGAFFSLINWEFCGKLYDRAIAR
ncbi:MAG: superoxide dismutase [Phycisphaeraceae bacterium]|nr:superoxide dismutase [Phycisphaeraceae bacterium]